MSVDRIARDQLTVATTVAALRQAGVERKSQSLSNAALESWPVVPRSARAGLMCHLVIKRVDNAASKADYGSHRSERHEPWRPDTWVLPEGEKAGGGPDRLAGRKGDGAGDSTRSCKRPPVEPTQAVPRGRGFEEARNERPSTQHSPLNWGRWRIRTAARICRGGIFRSPVGPGSRASPAKELAAES